MLLHNAFINDIMSTSAAISYICYTILQLLVSMIHNENITSLQVSTKVTVNDIFSSTKATLSFNIPDHKSGKVSITLLH